MKNISTLFKNTVTKKIIIFFYENPQSIDTAKGIATWIGCDLNNVQIALNRLVSEGILINHKTSSIDAYSYTNKKDIVKGIDAHIKNKI